MTDAIASPVDFGLFLPQLAMDFPRILDTAQACEDLGLHSVWLMDHLYPPGLKSVGSLEAWTTATAILARTSTLRVGHLVLANAFRHPALLAKMATTLDHISGGRIELGIWSGSVPEEFAQAGIPLPPMRERSEQLGEALQVLRSMFTRERTTFAGNHYQLDDLPNLPAPSTPGGPRIHIGGVGERYTLPLVARYADVWNLAAFASSQYQHKRAVLDDLCAQVGRDPSTLAVSQQIVIGVAADATGVTAVQALAQKRYGGPGWDLEHGACIGTPDQVVQGLRQRVEQGVRTFLCVLPDRGAGSSLELLAREVMPAFR